MILRKWLYWENELGKRGGTGYGIPSTLLPSTSYLTGPPASTNTKNRSLHPNIAGSTGGFIGLISGIAVVVIFGLLLGFYLYNRHRRRLTSSKTRHNLPSLHISEAYDPYAETGNTMDDVTPRASHFPAGISRGPIRPGYVRQKSEEWEIPDHLGRTHSASSSQGNGKGKGKDPGEWVDVALPSQPDEAALPLRSRSPRPASPRGWSDDAVPSLKRVTSGGSKASQENPFESEDESGYDMTKLSPRTGDYQRGGRPLPQETREANDPLRASGL